MTEFPDDGKPHYSLKTGPIAAARGPKRCFIELMKEVEMRLHRFRKDAWNASIELVADYLGIIEKPWQYVREPNLAASLTLPVPKIVPKSEPRSPDFQMLKTKVPASLIEQYVLEAKRDPWDYPGDVFVEEEMAGRANSLGQCLTPRGVIEMMVKMTIGEKVRKPYSFQHPDYTLLLWQTTEMFDFNNQLADISLNLQAERARRHTVLGMRPLLIKYDPEPLTDLDPCTGTGRFLLGATLEYPQLPLILFGVEIDVSLYRACLVNMAMFSNHPYSIICADTLMLDISQNDVWHLGNQWQPPDMSPFYFKVIPPYKFSLKDLIKPVAQQPQTPQLEEPMVVSQGFSLRQLIKK